MRHLVALAFAIAGCIPPQQPGYYQGPGYAQPYAQTASAAGAPAAPAASATCRDTITCYGQCNPLTQACITQCDQRATPDSSQNAHAVLQCMAQSGCQDQSCVVQRCSAQLTTCTNVDLAAAQPGAPAPAPAASGGSYDLVYQIPQGWNESRTYLNAITLGFDQEDFYNHVHPRIHIFPSRPRQGAIDDQFRALWNELVVTPGEFSQMDPPRPMRRRTGRGYAMDLDARPTTLTKGGYVTVGLYVIYTDDKLVPILTTNLSWQLDGVVNPFFDGVEIRGEAPSKTPLFATRELAGHWSTQAVSLSSYVNANGDYAGDASLATADGIFLDPDGSFRSHFVGLGRGQAVQTDDSGQWSIDDDTLVLSGHERTERRRIWGRGAAPQGNPDSLCMVPYGDSRPTYTKPDDQVNSSWYGKAK